MILHNQLIINVGYWNKFDFNFKIYKIIKTDDYDESTVFTLIVHSN